MACPFVLLAHLAPVPQPGYLFFQSPFPTGISNSGWHSRLTQLFISLLPFSFLSPLYAFFMILLTEANERICLRTIYSSNKSVVLHYRIVLFCVPAILSGILPLTIAPNNSSLWSFEYRMLNINACSMFFLDIFNRWCGMTVLPVSYKNVYRSWFY